MRTRHWLIAAALTLAAFGARADLIKLKDGTSLEGEITSEDEKTVSILLELAGGTITQTRYVNKTDIASVARWTPEEKARRKIERDYEDLQKYKLNPGNSYPVDYYNQVIQNAFRKFLTDHPDSPYTSNIIQRAGEWIAERDRVAGGQTKYQGKWVPTADVDGIRGNQYLQAGRAAMARGDLATAIQQLRPVIAMTELPELATQARALLTTAYQQAYAPLIQQQQSLQNELPSAQQRLDQAAQNVNRANDAVRQTGSSFAGPRDAGGSGYTAMGNNGQQYFQNQQAVRQAQDQYNAAQAHLAEVQRQLAYLKERTTTLQSQASASGIQVTGEPTPATSLATQAQSSASSTNTGDSAPVLTGMADWMRNNWMILAGAVLVAIYLLSRLTKG